jgi:GNAT superfamily N-acetyltransferase
MITVASVTRAQLPELLRLLASKADFDGARPKLRANLDNLEQELFSASPRFKAMLATRNGEIVGMATYHAIFSSFLVRPGIWLDDLYVDSAHRKTGVGEAILGSLCEEALTKGCARIDWIVNASNDNGLGFYARMSAQVFKSGRLARLDEEAMQALAASTQLSR